MLLNKVCDSQRLMDKNNRSLSDKAGFFILCVLLAIQPFHFITGSKFIYYREFFALLFFVLMLRHLQKSGFSCFRRKEMFFLILFLLFIVFAAFFDSGIDLYGGTDLTLASETLSYLNPTIYILRNAFLYIPMVFYIYLRGLTKKEITIICSIIAIAAPFSIISFLRHKEIIEMGEILSIVELGGHGLSYNTFVTYLTFPFITALYLLIKVQSRVLKILFLGIILIIFSYLLLTASRQSILFVILVAIGVLIFAKLKVRLQLLLFITVGIIFIGIYSNYVTTQYAINPKIIERYSSVQGFAETRRFLKMKRGLELLSAKEYIFGAGLSSVVVSGPHNDYIRWTQRIGILGMILSFAPFFIAFRYNLKDIKKKRNNIIYFLTSSGLFYTLYYSFFGYPRDDAYQSLYVFLGLALWLVVSRVDGIQFASERAGKRGHASRNQ